MNILLDLTRLTATRRYWIKHERPALKLVNNIWSYTVWTPDDVTCINLLPNQNEWKYTFICVFVFICVSYYSLIQIINKSLVDDFYTLTLSHTNDANTDILINWTKCVVHRLYIVYIYRFNYLIIDYLVLIIVFRVVWRWF